MSALLSLPIRKKGYTGRLAQLRGMPVWLDLPADWKNHLGFVYRITNNETGRFYIGKKLFFESAGKKNNRRLLTESNWRRYWGSCRELQEDIKNIGYSGFTRSILCVQDTKSALALAELAAQLYFCFKNTNTYNGIINVRLRFNESMNSVKFPWDYCQQ